MEHSIGVGAIVGLTFASSIYDWNNGRFSITQKTLLLICIIFPPAQWLGILIVSIYNSNVENNTPERKTEKKLDSTISNLTELKNKGILTEEEYKTKVDKIETEKEEQNLKNSLEYRQLKSLFEGGILTTEEFDSKVYLLTKVSEKEVDTKEISKILDSVNKTYIESTEEKVEEKKQNLTSIYLLLVLAVILLIGGLILFSNLNNNNSENVYSPPVIDTSSTYNTNSYNTNYQEPLKIKKFVYVVIKVEKPTFDVYQPISRLNSLGFYETADPIYSVNYENEVYYTEIVEVDNYNEDEKYKIIDNAKSKMRTQLEIYDGTYRANVIGGCKEEYKVKGFQKEVSKIKETQIYEFDSYSEASRDKESKNLQ